MPRYLWANPQASGQPRLWGLPVVATNSMTAGSFLIGDFKMGAAIAQREEITVTFAEQHADFFVTNMWRSWQKNDWRCACIGRWRL